MRDGVCYTCIELARSTNPIPFEPVCGNKIEFPTSGKGLEWFDSSEPVKPKVYSVDLDNTLTIGSAWTCDECEALPPRQDAIDRVNSLAEKNFIVIHTARRHGLYQSTIRWLEANHVRYHAISMAKMPCDRLFDLDAVNKVEDL
jgi:hypothetical protein